MSERSAPDLDRLETDAPIFDPAAFNAALGAFLAASEHEAHA